MPANSLSEVGPRVPPNTPANIPKSNTHSSSAQQLRDLSLTPPPTPRSLVITQRVSALPLVACTLQAYANARREGNLLSLGLLCSEVAVGLATLPARAVAAPLATLCPLPLRVGDKLLCFGLDCVEKVAPCIKGPPRKMCRPIRVCYRTSRDKIMAIPGLAWMTTNNILSSSCGRALMAGADRLILSVDGCIDLVLPSPESPDANGFLRLLSKLAHIPTKSARRVFEILLNLMCYVADRAETARFAAEIAEAARRTRHELYAQRARDAKKIAAD